MDNSLRLPSERSFGWTFTALFALVGLYAYPWLIVLAAATALVTVARAQWLAPANRAWMRFGLALNRVVSPLVIGLIFFAVFTPVAVVMRLAGRDALKLRFERAAPSYWVRRDPPGPPDDSFREMY
jgi:Saxitoxin biosynthesis operon protein SxtJ